MLNQLKMALILFDGVIPSQFRLVIQFKINSFSWFQNLSSVLLHRQILTILQVILVQWNINNDTGDTSC